jgi:IPT/TIG domain/PKD domain
MPVEGIMDRVSLRCAAVALLACSVLAAGAAGASAVIVHPQPGKTLSYQPLRGALRPFDKLFSNLDYNGGPVMPSNTNYAFYWAPSGSPAYPADYQPGVNGYLEDLAHDSGGIENVDSISAQYNDAAGRFAAYSSHFGGALIDTNPYPPNGCTRAPICLTDAQLQTELKSYVKAHGLPHDIAHEYFLLTPPGVENCFTAGGLECSAASSSPVYCAYHGNILLAEGELIYSTDPYVTGVLGCDDGNHPNGTTADGALQGGLSHEHNESITDPEPNNAWTDLGGSGGEIGDKCGQSTGAALGTAPNGASYNQLINGHLYWYQQEWSNQTSQCLQRLTFAGAEPTAAFTSTQLTGNQVSFDASGSTAPGGVASYNWQFNDGPSGPSAPTETTTPTVTHTFPAAGVYPVALTVFAANGTSLGAARTLVVGNAPRPTVTRVTPAKGPASGGTTVTITGTNFTAASAVLFGSTPATSFTVKSSKAILAITPAAAATTVDVKVTTPAGTSTASLADHFRFAPPTITELTPSHGPTTGPTSVTVSGTGFALAAGATAFKLGTIPVTSVNCGSTTSCTIVVPAHKAGSLDLRATVEKVVSPKVPADLFTYS